MELKKIRIAIAGHTNTGKTTLIRTLMKSSVGEVGDLPNVTKKGNAYFHYGLQADFVDTPGFQYASVVLLSWDFKQENPDFKVPKNWEDKINYDLDAIEVISNADVVLYLGNLSVVPDDSYKDEIAVVKKLQPKAVAVLNQYKKQLKASDEEVVNNRIDQWKKVLNEQNINDVIIFDAHWDSPKKITKIYDCIYNVLDEEQKLLFTEGLKQFKNRELSIQREAFYLLSLCIEDCQNNAKKELRRTDYSTKENIEQQARVEIARIINGSLTSFLYRVTTLYEKAAENPTASKEDLMIKINSSINLPERIGIGSSAAGILGAFGAAVGGTIGAIGLGIFTGGLGMAEGAIGGAQLGGMIGAAIGSIATFSDTNDIVTIKIESEQVRYLLSECLAYIWGLSNYGFGRGRDLTQKEIEEIRNNIDNLVKSTQPNTNWLRINKNKLIKLCENILNKLERKA